MPDRYMSGVITMLHRAGDGGELHEDNFRPVDGRIFQFLLYSSVQVDVVELVVGSYDFRLILFPM